MEGQISDNDIESRGMISRTIEQIFNTKENLKEQGWEYEMYASFLEIYNENIRDLLNKGSQEELEYKIVDDNKTITVSNVKNVKIKNEEHAFKLLLESQQARSVGSTNMNDRSSRSHSVFQLHILGNNVNTGEKTEGYLNLIDLAGSEKIDKSGVQGIALTETKNINSSLSHLKTVITSLSNNDDHTPYRNSKLTHLLKYCLGGNSKTLMFVNISPSIDSIKETKNSLTFATEVNNCEIGVSKKNNHVIEPLSF